MLFLLMTTASPVPAVPLPDEPWGAEDAAAEDDHPRIPEPMVFDLVRPLAARRGELEVNVLSQVPLGPRASGRPVAWAPEIELAVADGLALELELPMEDADVEAYKAAAQLTLGTPVEGRYVHGLQAIVEREAHANDWSVSGLYLGGLRLTPVWSALGMLGLRTATEGGDAAERTEQLTNLTVFADLPVDVTLGLESVLAFGFAGGVSALLVPQVHWEITDHVMLQSGLGVRLTRGIQTEAIFRLIRSF